MKEGSDMVMMLVKVGRASRSWVPSEARVRAFNMIDPLIGQKSRRTTSALNLPTVPLSSFLSTSTQTSLMWAEGGKKLQKSPPFPSVTLTEHLSPLLSDCGFNSRLHWAQNDTRFSSATLTHTRDKNHRQGNLIFFIFFWHKEALKLHNESEVRFRDEHQCFIRGGGKRNKLF